MCYEIVKEYKRPRKVVAYKEFKSVGNSIHGRFHDKSYQIGTTYKAEMLDSNDIKRMSPETRQRKQVGFCAYDRNDESLMPLSLYKIEGVATHKIAILEWHWDSEKQGTVGSRTGYLLKDMTILEKV